MDHVDRKLLIYQYPTLRHFIDQCFDNNEAEKVMDFLFSVETHGYEDHRGH